MNVLIVDDSNDKISKIAGVINSVSKSCNIDTVIDGVSALTQMQAIKYDLLILDLLLPMREGLKPVADGGVQLLKEISRSNKIKSPTIIVGITQYEEYKDRFSNIWKLLLFNNDDWKSDLVELIEHLEKSIKHPSQAILKKMPTVIVEGETDEVILKEALNLFRPDVSPLLEFKSQKKAGANWVANQVVVWAKSANKDEKGELIKCVGLMDGDQAGLDATSEINRIVKSGSAGASSFKVIKLKADYAKDVIQLYQKGLLIPICLEEMYPPSFWKVAEYNGWLEDRSKIDTLLKDPQKWNKMEQSLNDYIDSLKLHSDELVYLKRFNMSSKKESVKHILALKEEEKRDVLRNFKPLIEDIISYLIKE